MNAFNRLSLATLVLSLFAAADAGAITVATWNFNSLTNSTAPSNANVTSYTADTGTGTLTLGSISSSATGGITNFGGTTVNAFGGAAAGQALAIQGNAAGSGNTAPFANNGATLTFQVSLVGLMDPILSFAVQRTSTGFNSDQVAYSTDGVSFTNFGTAFNAATAFALQTFDFSAINALDGAASAFFRITLNGATNGAGNNRFDNIQINAIASAVPETSSTMMVLAGLAAVGFIVRRQRG
jgi:hypothetical protein